MERKSLVLILLALCVLFILEQEVFQFDTFSTRPAAAAQKANLTRSGPQQPPPGLRLRSSSGPAGSRRSVLFSRSRTQYEGNWNGGKVGRGLEGLVQAELDRKEDGGHDSDLESRQFGDMHRAGDEVGEDEDEGEGEFGFDVGTIGGGHGSMERLSDGDERSAEEENDRARERIWGHNAQLEEEKMKTSPYIFRAEDDRLKRIQASKATDVKYVSYYLPWEVSEHSKRFTFCLYNNCAFVNNMSLADVVVFKASNIRDHVIPPFYRPKDQRWLMYTADPATKKYAFLRDDAISSFNWTMTYQLDADAARIFGRLRWETKQPDTNYDRLFDNKARTAAWFVSHCPTWSKREDYVKRMLTVMDVDIFGECGNLSCGVSHYRQNDKNLCLPMLTNDYKFYLSFENSFCPDYITEKFFKLFEHVSVIPVVRGGFNYKKYLPNGIYVDAADFKTPEALARYLVELGNDKERYLEMLRRKDRWVYVPIQTRHCRICEHINTHWNDVGYHPNLRYKFNGHPLSCWSPTDLDL